jgi:hypothetical protein
MGIRIAARTKGGVMKSSIVVLVAFVIAGAAIYASSGLWAAPATEPVENDGGLVRLPPAASAGESVLYGHIASLTPRGDGFEMQFDPAWWLNGETASRAALEDTGSSDVPNDYYIVEEGHRLLTYLVPATARVSVLTGGRPATTTIPVSELARMVNDEQPRAGFWILVDHRYPSPVLSLDQQYQP